MWEAIEARVAENDRDEFVPLRRDLFEAIKATDLKPGGSAKKMVTLEASSGDRIVWQIENSARHFYLGRKWQQSLETAGFACKEFPYQDGKQDGGRHSNLSRAWSFESASCVQVTIDSREAFQKLLSAVHLGGGELHLDPVAVTRWIERLRRFFPSLDRFDRPDTDFDASERGYKLETSQSLQLALQSADGDRAMADAILSAASASNLLDWRTYLPLTAKGGADRSRLDPALAALARAALTSPDGHGAALEAFSHAWKDAVPKGPADAARQIGEFLFLHLWPDEAVYIRFSVREDLWREAMGVRFPAHASLVDTYADELRFMRAVRRALGDRGLAPRDMIDVQSALWVVHNYVDEPAETGGQFDRIAVETAMDAFDDYQSTGNNKEIFAPFGDPRDYWVRSTRSRGNRVHPTKPIVGYLLKKTELNGGWGHKADAAARLHNAGFIIVDHEDKPVAPPEGAEYLIADADRIRLCALNYFVEPARERGESHVSVKAGDLAADMGLKNAFPNICSALGGSKFQQLAQVPVPTHTEPNNSSTTTFTYQLAAQKAADTMPESKNSTSPSATNLILYGPPGTGKTYQTAWEAVRLCLGEEAAAALTDDGRRDALMTEYRRLVDEGRIEFVTFHQSMSYEEFVEGLRPTAGTSDEHTGFSLQVEKGIFVRAAERALKGPEVDGAIRLDGRQVFKMSIGNSRWPEDAALFQAAIADGYALFGFDDIDWSDERFAGRAEIARAMREVGLRNADATESSPAVRMTDDFRNKLEIGDILIVSKGNSLVRAIGEVTGAYEFHPRGTPGYSHRRAVRWLWWDFDGIGYSNVYDRAFTQQTIYRLSSGVLNVAGIEALINKSPSGDTLQDAVLIIDEINRANISKVFGELITLLEPDKRLGMPNEIRVVLPYSKRSFGVPANLHIIGTMNTADRSIALLDTALRRRFIFRELMPDPSVLRVNVDGIDLQKLLTTINDRIEYLFDREHQIGHAYFTGCRTRDEVDEVMRHKVIPLLAEYFYEDWSRVAAVLGDAAQGPSRFLEARRLSAPNGLDETGLSGDKLRWRVKDRFDFSEFAV